MCSYNRLNNSGACENSKSLNGLLKTELGYNGFIVTDVSHWGIFSVPESFDISRRTMIDSLQHSGTLKAQVLLALLLDSIWQCPVSTNMVDFKLGMHADNSQIAQRIGEITSSPRLTMAQCHNLDWMTWQRGIFPYQSNETSLT